MVDRYFYVCAHSILKFFYAQLSFPRVSADKKMNSTTRFFVEQRAPLIIACNQVFQTLWMVQTDASIIHNVHAFLARLIFGFFS